MAYGVRLVVACGARRMLGLNHHSLLIRCFASRFQWAGEGAECTEELCQEVGFGPRLGLFSFFPFSFFGFGLFILTLSFELSLFLAVKM